MALLVKLGKSAGERQMIKGGDEREREREREGEDRRFSFMATLLRRKKATMLHCLVGAVALTVECCCGEGNDATFTTYHMSGDARTTICCKMFGWALGVESLPLFVPRT